MDISRIEAALMLGHTGTGRIDQLMREGRIKPGSQPRMLNKESVQAYLENRAAAGRAASGVPVFYKVKLTEEQAAWLIAQGEVKCHGLHVQKDGVDVITVDFSGLERVNVYDADQRKASSLRNAMGAGASEVGDVGPKAG